jgi:hypothetical protein
MCLIINSNGYFLQYRRFLVGAKTFEPFYYYRGSKEQISLEPYFMKDFKYPFYKLKDFLMVQERRETQQVIMNIDTKINEDGILRSKIERNFLLGYHIKLFHQLRFVDCFETFGLEDGTLTLPIFTEMGFIEMVGDGDAVVRQFWIPNSEIYGHLCEVHDVEPSESMINILDKIFESY